MSNDVISAGRGGGGEAGTNYRGQTVQKGAQCPTVLHKFFVSVGGIIISGLHRLTR
jgi:hypothetical protein